MEFVDWVLCCAWGAVVYYAVSHFLFLSRGGSNHKVAAWNETTQHAWVKCVSHVLRFLSQFSGDTEKYGSKSYLVAVVLSFSLELE